MTGAQPDGLIAAPAPVRKVLTIAGSDSSGGAGIQADIKTIAAHGAYAMSVITALTAQNTMGVFGVQEASQDIVAAQMDAVFEDIMPDAVKIGMVSSAPIIRSIAERLRHHNARQIVLDPVMVATSGSRLLDEGAIETLTSELFALACVVTPNIPEAEMLSGIQIRSREDMLTAARRIAERHCCAVLIKGGHLSSDSQASDLLLSEDGPRWLDGPRIDTADTHGTGCTLSAAIACGLAQGLPLHDSVREAKGFVTGALAAGLRLGHGTGPIDHAYRLRPQGAAVYPASLTSPRPIDHAYELRQQE
jgi:hydroxymethylpyrimidine/phosphomethylpyrimidine kinase